jgi:hypothetical protein
VDDRELETMFADAVGQPPPAGFDADDVVSASRRAQARRRSTITAVCGCFVLLLAGFGAVSVFTSAEPGESLSATATQSSVGGQPGTGPERPSKGGTIPGFSTQHPMQGGAGNGEDGPRAESASGCDKVDRELATALAGELPVTVNTADATAGRVCTTQARAAGFLVPGGTISVLLLAHGVTLDQTAVPVGSARAEKATAAGGTVELISTPDAGAPPPLADQLPGLAGSLATHF